MSSTGRRKVTAWARRFQQRTARTVPAKLPEPEIAARDKPSDPLWNYYRHVVTTNLPVFYRFALQTRSVQIRDIFAKVSSPRNLGLHDLLAFVGHFQSATDPQKQSTDLQNEFDSSVLLALADLLANTARNDLDTYSATMLYNFVQNLYGDVVFANQSKLQWVEALNDLGYYDAATAIGSRYEINQIAPLQLELLNLQRLRLTSSTDEWLAALNDLYSRLDMSGVLLLENQSLPLLDRLIAERVSPVAGPKISIIMPTFSPGLGIKTAVKSLLNQSWQNLEIIIVDDASPVHFQGLFEDLGALDSRIKVIHQEKNLGAYVARNTGLGIATGEFITTHDDDDWSHPDKLAEQVAVMVEDPSVVATTSAHMRVTDELELRRVNARAQFLQMNYSSLMFRSSIVKEVGNWDPVNKGGDSEFYTRLKEIYGKERIVGLHDKPLSFSRVWEGSLTSGEMSRGFFAYSRLFYRWAFRQWYWEAKKLGMKPVRKVREPRPYPIPASFEPGQRGQALSPFDVIYVTDFFRQATYANRAVREIQLLADAGLRVGYMHLYSPRTMKPAGVSEKLFELQLEGRVTQVSYDDDVETNILLVLDTSVGMFLDQISSHVSSYRSILVAHDPPGLLGSEPRTPTNLYRSIKNLDQAFNTTFDVIGASAKDQQWVREVLPHTRVLSDSFVWDLSIEGETAAIRPPDGVPLVGFHSYGNHYRWPSTLGEFNSVYRSPKFSTYFYGNIKSARKKFGSAAFAEASVISRECTEGEFLDKIDFWVYYPNRRLIDQLWEPVLKAMQAGKVVLLPERLRELYGDAAVYCDPTRVPEVVEQYSNDQEKYREQAKRGQAFVTQRFPPEKLIERIGNLL